MRVVRVRGLRALALILASPFPIVLAQAVPPECNSALCKLLATANLPSLRWPDFSDHSAEVHRFYEPTGYALAWTKNGTPTGQAVAVIRILREADSKGLNAQDYDGSHWADWLAGFEDANHPATESELAEFDLAVINRYFPEFEEAMEQRLSC